MEIKSRNHSQAIDLLRIVSIAAVILIHTTTKTFEITGNNLSQVPITLFFNQISRFAVPLFFLISGFVLELNYHNHTGYTAFIKKRVNRVLIPYVFWSFIYYFFVYTQHTDKSFLSSLVLGNSSYQLYFVPALLIFYVLFPLIHRYYSLISKWYLLTLFGILEIIFLYYDYHVRPLPFSYPISVVLLNYFVFILGMIASHHQDRWVGFVKKWKVCLVPSTTILGFYVFFQGKSLYQETHNYLSFYSQWRPSVLIYSILIISLMYYFFNKLDIKTKILKTLAELSFLVFFVHVIVLELVWKILSDYMLSGTTYDKSLWYDPVFFLTTLFVSFLLSFILRKIPILSRVVS